MAAVEQLRRAIAGGYSNVEHLKRSPDLDSLRARSDFKNTVAALGTPAE